MAKTASAKPKTAKRPLKRFRGWAIRFHKHVEVRLAVNQPAREKTTVKFTGKVEKLDSLGRRIHRMGEKTITQVVHTGGIVVGIMPLEQFRSIDYDAFARLYDRGYGDMVEMDVAAAKRLRDAGGIHSTR